MLIKFSVKGFRNFDQKIELDLTKVHDFDFNSFAIKDGVIKNGIIFGMNGSGKSNLGMAIFDIVQHLAPGQKNLFFHSNYTYASSKSFLVTFEYTFNFDGQIVEYTYSKDSNCNLQEEKLLVDGKKVFSRMKEAFEIDENLFPMTDNTKEKLKKNENRISVINFLVASFPLNKSNCLMKMKHFVSSMLWFHCINRIDFFGSETRWDDIDEYIIQNNLVEEFADFLKEVSGQNFDFIKYDKGEKILYVKIKDSKMVFKEIASDGTRSLLHLFYWIKKLNEASFVFIDAFDSFYHFKLSLNVCKILFKHDCQVFLTSHNTYLMTNDLLRPDCLFILDNGKISSLCSSTDKKLLEEHNIERLYRGDTFAI